MAREKQGLPTPLRTKPELADSLQSIYDDFWAISRTRKRTQITYVQDKVTKSALVPDPISISDIEAWIRIHGIRRCERANYCYLISRMDIEYISFYQQKIDGKASD